MRGAGRLTGADEETPLAISSKWRWKAKPRKPAPTLDGDMAAAAEFLGVSEDILQTVSALCAAGVPPEHKITAVWTREAHSVTLNVQLDGFGLLQQFRRTEDGELMVNFQAMLVPSAQQRRGHGSESVRNSLIAYDLLGVRYVSAYANFDIGGFAWAKLAGAPTNPDLVRSELLTRLQEPEIIMKLTSAGCDTLAQVVRDAHDDTIMLDVALSVSSDAPAIPLGERLLLGFRWDAIWDLTDLAQRRRVEGALG